ncbi:MAG: hypothetical protein AB7O04_10395 [Hyphomonadaceae bacterium]
MTLANSPKADAVASTPTARTGAAGHSISASAMNLIDDPGAFFGHSLQNFYNVPYQELLSLQLEGLQYRFSALRDRIPMLQKLADAQDIHEIRKIDDVVPLLFEHTMYKSYPPSLLENNRFGQINKWLSKLTVYDFSGVPVDDCQTVDDWLAVMDRDTPLRISHSSGTTGTMSFLPIGDEENHKNGVLMWMRVWNSTGPMDRPDMIAIQPYYRFGGSTPLRVMDDIVKYVLGGDESKLFAAYPTRMSSDVLYLAARIRKARSNGTLDRLKISPALMERQKEFEQVVREMPQRLAAFFEEVLDTQRGKRVVMMGLWPQLHNFAQAGMQRGLANFFHPESFVKTGGGAKGVEPPATWQEDVCRFMGIKEINQTYAMSEVRASHDMCAHGHYHFSPTVIPFQLDPDTSEVLPRQGKVTGRAAFFDLCAEGRWGGFITGDAINVDWDTPCPCGRTVPFVYGPIRRYSEMNGGVDDKISCAATENAHKEAMDFLTSFAA